MRRTRWWGLVSAGAAPVLLVGGWTLAARLQEQPFDGTRETISALAAHGATQRWVMTTALLAVGACHVASSLALRDAAPAGRLVLAAGGLSTAAIALFPLPSGDGGSAAHAAAGAAAAFGALAVWPALSWRREPGAPAVLRPPVAVAGSLALLGLVAWFTVELLDDSGTVGRAERAAAAAQALWPLAAVVSARR